MSEHPVPQRPDLDSLWEYADPAGSESRSRAALRTESHLSADIRAEIHTWTVARCLRTLGRPIEALALQQALAKEPAAAGEDDPYVDEEIGECLLALGRGTAAPPQEVTDA